MDVNQWMIEQFSQERCHRWVDGSRTKQTYGHRSFVQVLSCAADGYKHGRLITVDAPHIWSVVRCSALGGLRWTYYLTVYFYAAASGGVLAKLKMWSNGIYARIPARCVESEVVFKVRENAPKKLNREIRRLRELILQQAGVLK